VRGAEALVVLCERLRAEDAVVASLGTPSYHLVAAGDRPLNFYLWASMGMASSVGLGLAVARPDRRVVVVDGDGAALMNLGSFVTVGWRAPRNLVWLVLENGVFLETGGQPVATGAARADLAGIARAAGIPSSSRAGTATELGAQLDRALAEPGPHVVVARVDADANPARPPADPVRLKNRFMDALG
jgi:phosphonopyruvate decarboxylase